MTENRRERGELDGLLKRTFADDLPADVAAGMRDRVERFRAGRAKGADLAAARAWLLRRSAWAVLSVLALAAGIALQGSGSRSTLADKISLIKTEIASAGTGQRHDAASAARLVDPDGSIFKRRTTHDRVS